MRSIFTMLMLLVGFSAFCQDKIEAKLHNVIALGKNQKFVASDMYDDIYFLEGNVLKKKNKYTTASFSKPSLGIFTNLDIQNLSQLVLFYRDTQTFVLVSKELAQLNMMDVSAKFPSVDLAYIGVSTKRDLWMMNEANGGIYRYNLGTLERYTAHTIKEKKAKYYSSTIHYFFWVENSNLVKGIDVNGKEVLSYQLDSDFDAIQIIDTDKLFYSYKGKLYYVDMLKTKQYEIVINEKSIESFFYNSQKMSIFAEEKINNYLIKLP